MILSGGTGQPVFAPRGSLFGVSRGFNAPGPGFRGKRLWGRMREEGWRWKADGGAYESWMNERVVEVAD